MQKEQPEATWRRQLQHDEESRAEEAARCKSERPESFRKFKAILQQLASPGNVGQSSEAETTQPTQAFTDAPGSDAFKIYPSTPAPLHRGSGSQVGKYIHHPTRQILQQLHRTTRGLDRICQCQKTTTWYWAIKTKKSHSTLLTALTVTNGLIGRQRTRSRNSIVHARARPQRTPTGSSSSRKEKTQALVRSRARHLIVMITVPAVREDACSKTQPVRLERRRRAS